MNHTIRAVRSDHSLAEGETIITDALYEMDYDVSALAAVDNVEGKQNLLTDTLYEMGYDHNENLVNTLIARNVIDFSWAWYTSHVIDELIERYGEEVLCGGLIGAVVREGLTTELRNAGGPNFRWQYKSTSCNRCAAKGDARVPRFMRILLNQKT